MDNIPNTGDKIYSAIIIILIIILFHSFYQQYLIDSQNTTIIWKIDKSYKIYLKLKEKFGEPSLIEINKISGVVWNLIENELFKKIILLDQEKNLLILTLYINLFAGYKNVQLTEKAIYNKLSQITGLSKNINYDTFSKNAIIKSDNLENALSLSLLLTKISTSELSLEKIIKNNLIKYYELEIFKNDDNCYKEIKKYNELL